MKLFHVYKSHGYASWIMPIIKGSQSIIYMHGFREGDKKYGLVSGDTESDPDEFNDSEIDISLIPEQDQQKVIKIIFSNDFWAYQRLA